MKPIKILFFSPLDSLWSDEFKMTCSLLKTGAVSFGSLLRNELKSDSLLGNEIKSDMDSGKIISDANVCKILAERYFHSKDNTILSNFPLTPHRVDSVSEYIRKNELAIDAIVAVEISKENLLAKFKKQFHCLSEHSTQMIESENEQPICSQCGSGLRRAFDITNPNLVSTVERYCNEQYGDVVLAKYLSKNIDSKYINFSSAEEVSKQILGQR